VVEISLLGSERARVGNRPGYSTRFRSLRSLRGARRGAPRRQPPNVIRNDATRVSGLVSGVGDGRGSAYGTSGLSRNARK